jgi:hypothetical protein
VSNTLSGWDAEAESELAPKRPQLPWHRSSAHTRLCYASAGGPLASKPLASGARLATWPVLLSRLVYKAWRLEVAPAPAPQPRDSELPNAQQPRPACAAAARAQARRSCSRRFAAAAATAAAAASGASAGS